MKEEELKREKDKDPPPTCSLSNWVQQPGAGSGARKSIQVSYQSSWNSGTWIVTYCLPGTFQEAGSRTRASNPSTVPTGVGMPCGTLTCSTIDDQPCRSVKVLIPKYFIFFWCYCIETHSKCHWFAINIWKYHWFYIFVLNTKTAEFIINLISWVFKSSHWNKYTIMFSANKECFVSSVLAYVSFHFSCFIEWARTFIWYWKAVVIFT